MDAAETLWALVQVTQQGTASQVPQGPPEPPNKHSS